MSTPSKHRGVIVPMVTPFTAAGELDVAAAERLTEHLASNGLGVFVLGTTGEASSMHQEQRHRLVELAVSVASGRSLVYAGIGDNCVSSSVAAAHEYLALGASGVVAHLPSYYLLGDAEMYSYFKYLADGIGRSLVIYNMPQTTRMSLSMEVLQRLAELPAITGLKDSENAPGRIEQTAALFCGRPDFSVFIGVALLSTQALRLGFDGLVPSSGNIVPALWNRLFKASQGGYWSEVEELQRHADAIAQVFQRGRTLGQSLGALKACLCTLGLCETHMLPPLQGPNDDERAAVAAALAPLLSALPR